MSNRFTVYELISDSIYTKNILGNVDFEKVPQVSGKNFIYNNAGVNSIQKVTQNEYDALTPNSDTLYIIVE
jgi:hypothetical protein